jgi:hypothetical protein
VNSPLDHAKKRSADYELKPCVPSELTQEELKTCMALIGAGGAVNPNTMKRDLPRSQVLVIARHHGQIVGVGVIKPVRKQYSAGIAVESEHSFPSETPELGYVSVDLIHQGHGLSHEITELLVSQYPGRLFATTDSRRMKKTLADAGFCQKGKEWQGERGMLSYWEKV